MTVEEYNQINEALTMRTLSDRFKVNLLMNSFLAALPNLVEGVTQLVNPSTSVSDRGYAVHLPGN